MREASGGVDDHDVATEARRLGHALAGYLDGVVERSEKTSTPTWAASTRSCSTAAGRWRSAATR